MRVLLKSKPLQAFAIFASFLLVSATLLASRLPSFGPVTVGDGKVVISYGPYLDARADGERRLMQPLAPASLEAEAKRFTQVIREVGDIARGMRMPPHVHLSINAVHDSPSSDSYRRELALGQRFGVVGPREKLYTQHPDEMLPVVAHEFGHMLFFENVISRIGMVNALKNDLESFAELARARRELKAQALGSKDPRAFTETPQWRQKWRQWEFDELAGKLRPVFSLGKATSPYNEYFADVVAVLYSEEPNSIADAVHFARPAGTASQRDASRMSVRNRAFDRKGAGRDIVRIPHGVFFEARAAIWDEFLSRPAVMKGKKNEVLQGLTRATLSELSWYLRLPRMPREPQSLAEIKLMNERLILAIRKELRHL